MAGLEATQQSGAVGSYSLAVWLFLRLLGLIYLAAFLSLGIQIRGLLGRGGLLPARELLAGRAHWGWARFQRWPTLCWLRCTDGALLFLTWGGTGLSLLLVAGVAPLPVLVLLWAFYLSLFTVGRLFLCYQWDILLLEAGWLAVLIAPIEFWPHWPTKAPAPIALLLLWWLLFRLMFWSGMVKLRSGDISWRKLTALQYHYETQPLPAAGGWYVHQLPPLFHKLCAAIVLVIELITPFLIFLPAPWKYAAAWAFIVLMISIQLTGNYAFFNLLGIALSVLLFDDHALRPLFGVFTQNTPPGPVFAASAGPRLIAAAAGLLVLLLSLESAAALFRLDVKWPAWLARWFDRLEPFHFLNSYGLFAVMTTWRPEIILEGSYDRRSWEPYEFKWKPGDVRIAPRWIAPHQPRLDWQMWFLALGAGINSSWFERLRERLIEGSPEVLKLLKTNPFPDGPPRYVRGVYYDYRFTSWSERKATGAWWRRERRGLFEG
ncbi:MAG TPA: lipase maturation factor family protein [Verrucomicrobiae bacterium]|nr:lipase maturation factor family protein [Verrucomicrobiae bacterium]